MAYVKNHTFGETRYLTYYLIFPKDKDVWVDSIPFAQPLDLFLKNTKFKPNIARDILIKGEALWRDNNGVTHQIKILEHSIPRRWGVKRS